MNQNNKNIVLKKDIVNSSIPEHDRTLFIRFFNNLNLQSIGYKRQRKLLAQILNCYRLEIFDRGSPILSSGEAEVHNMVSSVAAMGTYERNFAGRTISKEYSENTKKDYRRLIRQLLNFSETIDPRFDSDCKEQRKNAREMYAAKNKIKTGPQRKTVHPSQIIKLDDFKAILKVIKSKRNKCLYAMLFFTGWRIGGLLNIKLKDIIRKDNCWLIQINDKTGIDTLPVYHCVPFIRNYLETSHVSPNDPESYLFAQKDGEPISQRSLNKIKYRTEKALKERFGISKNLTPHMFRHSRATRDCTKYPTETFKRIMKWSPNSNAMQHYLHLNSEDIEKQFAKVNNIEIDDIEEGVEWVCPKCTFINGVCNDYCDKCNNPRVKTLKEQMYYEKEEQFRLRSEFLGGLLENPKMLEMFQQWKQGGRS